MYNFKPEKEKKKRKNLGGKLSSHDIKETSFSAIVGEGQGSRSKPIELSHIQPLHMGKPKVTYEHSFSDTI